MSKAKQEIATLGNAEEVRRTLDSVMKDLEKEQYDKAFEQLKPYWPFPMAELDNLHRETKDKLPVATSRFGDIIGSDYVKTEKIGDFMVRSYYVLRFSKHILRMKFTFYNNTKGWIMNGFTWDDNVDELFS